MNSFINKIFSNLDKISKYMLTLSIITFLVGVVLILFLNKSGAEKSSNLINLCIAFGTIVSAAGLLYFGDSTYKNQKTSEFHDSFTNLINQYNAIIHKYISEETYFIKIIEIYKRLSSYVMPHNNEIDLVKTPEQFNSKIKKSLLTSKIFTQIKLLDDYFRLLYQLIKLVDQNAPDDKNLYINLIKAKTPPYLAFIAVLNSYYISEYDKEFQELVNKYAFLEYLPIDNYNWITDIYAPKYKYIKTISRGIEERKKQAEDEVSKRLGPRIDSLLIKLDEIENYADNLQNIKIKFFPKSVWGKDIKIKILQAKSRQTKSRQILD